MNKLALATGVALVALTGGAQAADLIINAPAPVVAAPVYSDSSFYVELLGGASLDGVVEATDVTLDTDVLAGGAVAGVIGFGTGIEGLSVEADFFLTQREFDNATEDTLTTGSAMANLRYTVSLNDVFGVYGAVGLGGVYQKIDGTTIDGTVDGWNWGYQLKAGVTAQVAQNIAVIGEVRYNNTFDTIDGDDQSIQTGTTAVLAGVRFSF